MNNLLTLSFVVWTDNLSDRDISLIEVAPNKQAGIMKTLIFQQRGDVLTSSNMTLWKLKVPILLDNNFEERITDIDLQNSEQVEEMKTQRAISDYFPDLPPETLLHCIITRPIIPLSSAGSRRLPESTNQQSTFLHIIRERLTSPEKVTSEDLRLNQIIVIGLRLRYEPTFTHPFVNDFYQMLTHKAIYISNEETTDAIYASYITILKGRLGENFDDHFTLVGPNTPLPMGEYEAEAYSTAASMRRVIPYMTPGCSALMKEICLTGAIVDPALVRLGRNFNRNTVVTAIPIRDPEGEETLWPTKPDFHVSYGNPSTRYATLLGESESKGQSPEAAVLKCALMSLHAWRVAQMHGVDVSRHVVLSAFVGIEVCTMHIFYKDPSTNGKYYMQCILRENNMFGKPPANVRFLRMLFNFAAYPEPREGPQGGNTGELDRILNRLGSKGSTRQSDSHQTEDLGMGSPIAEEPHVQSPSGADQAQLAAAGYDFIDEPSFHRYRDILLVHSKGRHLVAKWTLDAEERRLLNFLQSAKSQTYRNSVIFVEEFLGPWIVMPYLTDLIKLDNLSLRGCLDVYSQLVEAVAFLHEQGVVHMDLKPSNLVFQHPTEPHGLLSIIDFNLAGFYKDGDQPFSGFCGTEGWTAPEVTDDGTYNPRYADIWAIGRITRYFFQTSKIEDNLSRRLMSDIPSERPTASDLFSELKRDNPKHPYVPGPEELPFPKRRTLESHKQFTDVATNQQVVEIVEKP